MLKLIILLLLSSCGDGNFDFSEPDNSQNTTNNHFAPEPNESIVAPRPTSSPSSSSGGDSDEGTGENPICTSVNGVDGSGGFLWKATSESNGNLVILFPKQYTKKFSKVEVIDLGLAKEEGNFSGFANGDRQHWRFDKPGSEYVGQVTAYSENGECQWQVSNPSERQD